MYIIIIEVYSADNLFLNYFRIFNIRNIILAIANLLNIKKITIFQHCMSFKVFFIM